MAKISGGKSLVKHLDIQARGRDVTDVLLRAADRVRTEYIDMVNEGGAPGPAHVPSKPGQPPNTDTGRLVGSVSSRVVRKNVTETSVEAEYGVPLEYGTDKMAPRPALRPAFNEMKPHILNNLRKALKDG